MSKTVTILTGEPTVIPIAEMRLAAIGLESMAEWVRSHRPECLPDEYQSWRDLFPHGLTDDTQPSNPEATVQEDRALTDNELLVELAGRKCIAEGTLIETTDGPKRIEAVVVGDHVVVPEGEFKVIAVSENGTKDIVIVETRDGYAVPCTADHLVHTTGGWVEAGALSTGDTVTLASGTTAWGGYGTFEEGYVCGLFLGDGAFAGDGFKVANIRLFGDKMQLMRYVEDVTNAKSSPHREGTALSLNSKAWGGKLLEVGVQHGMRAITPDIELASSAFQRGVLRGLWDTDGSLEVNGKTRRAKYNSSNRESLAAVQRMLLRLGIFSRMALDRDAREELVICGVKTRGKAAYKLTITGESFLRFSARIGSRRRHAALKAAADREQRKSPKVTFGEVLAVRAAGSARVYDLSVEEGSPHSFVANGIVVHNCYDSFGLKAGKKNNREYIEHTQGGDIPHACYDEATEVLTADGWKRWDVVTMEDRLATRAADGELVYQRPEALNDTYYNGKMYRVDGGGVDLLVTPNHRMYVCPTTTRGGREREGFDFITAEELDNRSHCYVKNATWKGGRSSTQWHRDVSALLGFALGDGCATHQGPLRFHLKKQRKISWLRAVTQRLGWELKEQAADAYVVQVPENYISMFWNMYDENGEKHIPQCYFVERDSAELEALLDGLLQSDGHKSKTNINYSSTSLRLLDQVQQLALHVGLAAHLHVDQKQCGHVNLIRRSLKPEVNRGSVLPRTRWEMYSGRVFCAQVPNGTLYVRRNGVPVWCGNSIMYHAKMSFFIAGLSRRVSHEFIRNYVGADRDEEGSPSQESTRFTHHYGFFIAPPRYLEPSAHAHAMSKHFRESMQAAYDNYLKAVDTECAWFEAKYGKKPTSIDKKRIYEAASSFLPHQAETSFIWTSNPAAIAKFVRERDNPAADLEIQRFARTWKRLCVGRWPNLFPQSFMKE